MRVAVDPVGFFALLATTIAGVVSAQEIRSMSQIKADRERYRESFDDVPRANWHRFVDPAALTRDGLKAGR